MTTLLPGMTLPTLTIWLVVIFFSLSLSVYQGTGLVIYAVQTLQCVPQLPITRDEIVGEGAPLIGYKIRAALLSSSVNVLS